MKHVIEMSTVEALLVFNLLDKIDIQNEIDKQIAERLKERIMDTVANQLSDHTVCHLNT